MVSQAKNEQWEIVSMLEEIGFEGITKRFDNLDEANQFLGTVMTENGESVAADAIFYSFATDSHGNFSAIEVMKAVNWSETRGAVKTTDLPK